MYKDNFFLMSCSKRRRRLNLTSIPKRQHVYYLYYENNALIKRSPIRKIVYLTEFIKNELTIQQTLRNQMHQKEHFYLCENVVELNIAEISEDDCQLPINGNTFKKSPIGNSVLLEFDNVPLVDFKIYFTQLSATEYIRDIVYFYKHLLNTVELLNNCNVFYNNIHFDTILIDNSRQIPVLNDFSFSLSFSKKEFVSHLFVAYDPEYLEWPIELHLLSYLHSNQLTNLSLYNIEQVIDDVLNHHSILRTFGDSVVQSFRTEAQTYFKKYANRSYNTLLHEWFEYAYTWDIYALNMLYLRILLGLQQTISENTPFIEKFMNFLVCNIHTNPSKRTQVQTIRMQFEDCLKTIKIDDYKTLINQINIVHQQQIK